MEFIHGNCSWVNLSSVGLAIRFKNHECVVEGAGNVVVSPTAADIAQGFHRLYTDAEALRQWAAVILAGSAIIDFNVIERHPSSEILIEALWDASITHPLSDDAIRIIKQLAGG
jgi:hypothetical protein